MIPKSNLKLRKIGSKYMIVETSDSCVNLTNVYSLNETAALLWEMLCRREGHTVEELAEELCKTYEVEYERALHDVESQLTEWEKMGLL
ncbi:PqqD family protein [Bacteroides sp.]|uniref:PqqD family protein n=1 Tax=Bacteroides sp. TaxID=29523 RepID=UPI0023CF84EF|nr:PqqD family protein [Bacteroides sp.]MDE6215495.1 PqqD family protein [Bacteroides sp.]